MDTQKLLEKDKPLWKQSPSIRRDAKKATAAIKMKFKILKYIFPLILLLTVPQRTQAQNNVGHNQPTAQNFEQNIIFFMEEVSKMASKIKNIHVAIISKISHFLNQGQSLGTYFNNLANTVS